MSIQILRPYVLVLIPVLIASIIWSRRYMTLQRVKRRLVLASRQVMTVLIILALSGLSLNWTLRDATNIFLVDVSSSAKAYEPEAEAFIQEALTSMPDGHEAGVLVFGQNVLVDRFVSGSKTFDRITSQPNETSTNLQEAITSALALLPEDRAKRIILLTDGQENEGSVEKLMTSLKEQKVDVKVVKIEQEGREEVYVDYLDVPERIHFGEAFNVVVNIKSNIATSAKLTLYSGRTKRNEMDVTLQKGDNRFVFKDTGAESGLKSYRVVIEPAIDTEVKNNEYTTFTKVETKPRVLLVEGTDGEGQVLEELLKASGVDYKKINTVGVPRTLNELTEFKSIIIANAHADDLNTSFLNNLKLYVRDYAGGLIVTGGEDAFALGAYRDTPLEEVLPVSMELEGEKEIPQMSLVMVIDQSGSMSSGNAYINKLQLAKEAAIEALETLRVKDFIGVLAFETTYDWVVEVQKAEDKTAIEEKIGGIQVKGGTSIYPALEQAYLAQLETDAKIKHIILLTDGQDGYRQYDELLEEMKANNITLSTVSVGGDSDTIMLTELAEVGQGRYYHTDINTDIPRIFAKEVFLSVKEYVNNREFYPVIVNSHSILNGVTTEGLPSLLGYIGASPKSNATVILESDKGDPILTVWQYGLGRTIAWNSDMAGRWSSAYTQWSKNLNLWQNILNYTIENYEEEGQNAKVTLAGTQGIIKYKTESKDGNVTVKAIATSETGQQKEVTLTPSRPGEYEGTMPLDEPGFYVINVREEVGGDIVSYVNTAVAMQYSQEYRWIEDQGTLEYLVEETEGTFITEPEQVFDGTMAPVRGMYDLTNLLLILALILFVLDITYRRLSFDYGRYMHKIRQKFPKREKIKEEAGRRQREETTILEAPVGPKKQSKKVGKVRKEEEKQKAVNTTASLLAKKKDRSE